MSLKNNGWDVDWFLIQFKSNLHFSNIVETQMNIMISIYCTILLLIPNDIICWIDDNYPMVALKSFGWVLNCHLVINVLGHSCNDLTINLERWYQLTIGQHYWLGQYLLWQLHFYINGYFFLLYFLNQLIIYGGFENNPVFFYVVLLNLLSIYG